jgi:hypothetical protein
MPGVDQTLNSAVIRLFGKVPQSLYPFSRFRILAKSNFSDDKFKLLITR